MKGASNTFNHATNLAKTAGNVTGMIMGKVVTNMEAAAEGFAKLAAGLPQGFLQKTAQAISVRLERGAAKLSIPFAQDAAVLALEEGGKGVHALKATFRKAHSEALHSEKTKAKDKKANAVLTRGLAPAGV